MDKGRPYYTAIPPWVREGLAVTYCVKCPRCKAEVSSYALADDEEVWCPWCSPRYSDRNGEEAKNG